ncbi:protein slender lobes-like [Anthonomus grandis grandis]|uniref:protein slender lobes-like n=1 Tax=Anthonomus grandis grandis TaxID=2921223 RepID=UPI0021664D66|nr:protein slender lobes-like [Anthonomus grandis grandis]
MPPKKSAVNDIQAEEAATVGSPVRRSVRNAPGNGNQAAAVSTRGTSAAVGSNTPAKITKSRRGSNSSTQSTEEIVETKPTRGRKSILASTLAEEASQKVAPGTPTRRGRKPSVTLEPTDQEEPEKAKPLRGRRLSRANSEDPEEPEKPKPARARRLSRANSEDPEPAEQPAKPVRGRRTSTTNTSEETNEAKSAPVRGRRGSATVDAEIAPKTPGRATGRRRNSATESVEPEVSTPAKRAGRGRKVSESTEEVFEEEKKPATRGRRKSVTKEEETTKEEPLKPATRRGRRASTDSNSAEVVAPKTPARITRSSSISQEDKVDVPTDEISPVIPKDMVVKLTPMKKRTILEKVEAELDLSIINESADDMNTSQNQSLNKSPKPLDVAESNSNPPKEENSSPRTRKRLSDEGEAGSSLKKSPRLSDKLQVDSRENSPIRKSPRLSAKIADSSPVRTSPRLSAKFAKIQSEQEEVASKIEPEKSEVIQADITEVGQTTIETLEKDIQAFDKSTTHVSTGSEGSFRFHLSTVSLPEEHHDEPLNDSKGSMGSNKENIDLYAPSNKSEVIPLQPKIAARISNVFKPNQRDFSFQEPMEVDNFSLLVNDTMGDKTVGTLDESSIECSKNMKSDISDLDCSVVFNKNPVKTSDTDLDQTTSDLSAIIVESGDKEEIKTEIEEECVINKPVQHLKQVLARKTSSPITNKKRLSRKSLSPVAKEIISVDAVESLNLQVEPRKSKSLSPRSKELSPRRLFNVKKDDGDPVSVPCGETKEELTTEVVFNESTIISANKAKRSVSPFASQEAVTNKPSVNELKHSESTVYDFELPSDDSDLDDSKEQAFLADTIKVDSLTQDDNKERKSTEISMVQEEEETFHVENKSKNDENPVDEQSMINLESEEPPRPDIGASLEPSGNIQDKDVEFQEEDLRSDIKGVNETSQDNIEGTNDTEEHIETTQDESHVFNNQGIPRYEETGDSVIETDQIKDENEDDPKEITQDKATSATDKIDSSETETETDEYLEKNTSILKDSKHDEAPMEPKEDIEEKPEGDKIISITEEVSEDKRDTDSVEARTSVTLKESNREEPMEVPQVESVTVNEEIDNAETEESPEKNTSVSSHNYSISKQDETQLEPEDDIQEATEEEKDIFVKEKVDDPEIKIKPEENPQEESQKNDEGMPTGEKLLMNEETDQCRGKNTSFNSCDSSSFNDSKSQETHMEHQEDIQAPPEADKNVSIKEKLSDSDIETDQVTETNMDDVNEENNDETSEVAEEEIPSEEEPVDSTTERSETTLNTIKTRTSLSSKKQIKELTTSEVTNSKPLLESNNSLRSRYSLDEFASAKLDEFLKSKAKDVEESDSSEAEEEECENEYNEFIDGMAEEGEEDTPSEDSNQIIDEGESIGSSDSEEEKSDDHYEDDSFICDDEDVEELLSGDEYDLGNEKKLKKKSRIIDPDNLTEEHDVLSVPKKEKVKPKKKSRIIKVSDSSSDEEEGLAEAQSEQCDEVIVLDDDDIVKEKNKAIEMNSVIVLEDSKVPDNSELDPNTSSQGLKDSFSETKTEIPQEPDDAESSLAQNVSLAALTSSLQKRNRRSSLSIQENIMLDGNKVPMITKRINSLVESFCSNVSKGEVSLNLSLEFEDTKQSADKTEPVHIVSDIKITPGIRIEANKTTERNQQAVELDDNEKEIKDLREVIEKKRLKRRLSRSLSELFKEEKKAKRRKKSKRSSSAGAKNKTEKQTRPDVSEVSNVGSFSLMNQLITDVKNRPKRVPKPSTDTFETSWMVTPVENPKPSTKTITKKEKLKVHPKDFKNQLLSDPQRVRRVETKILLKKKGVNMK